MTPVSLPPDGEAHPFIPGSPGWLAYERGKTAGFAAGRAAAPNGGKITHGRHCICSACAAEDWTNPNLAPCGMHGSSCPREYAPLGPAGRAAATPDPSTTWDASNCVRFCDRCDAEYGITAGADVGDTACSGCGAHDAPHIYPHHPAATPDPPEDARRPWPIAPDTVMPPRRQPVRWGSRADDPPTDIHDDPQRTKAYLAGLAAGRAEAAAASPDERLREALTDALEGMLDMRPYVPNYFAEKWDHDGYIERARAALEWRPLAAADREKPDA